MNSVHSSSDTIVCCDFSSDGKLLASGGHDNKVVLWYTHTLMPKTMFEEHSSLISDICFSPSMSYVATSSFDKSVRVWDTDIPAYSLRCFGGHSAPVMSLDFHPNKDDFMCSCDGDGEIRYWSITNGCCTGVFKGGMTQIRFQPCHGRYIAAASENLISILDVETQACLHRLQVGSCSILFLAEVVVVVVKTAVARGSSSSGEKYTCEGQGVAAAVVKNTLVKGNSNCGENCMLRHSNSTGENCSVIGGGATKGIAE
ncbi:hypothetical protein Ancab_022740 [Ancistrocladus abbreviatus]